MLPRRPPFPVIRKLGKTEWTPHVKEDPQEPLPLDPAHPHVEATLGMNQPPARLNAPLGTPLATGLLAGGMRAPPEGNLVGLELLVLTHHTLGAKTSGSADFSPIFFFLEFLLELLEL